MNPDRFLGPHKDIARELLLEIEALPLLAHGHVDPAYLSSGKARFPNPVELFLRPDHYLLRMLYSQGLKMEYLLDPDLEPRTLWKTFAENIHLFWGTPSSLWLEYQWRQTFELNESLGPGNAEEHYDRLAEKLVTPEYSPRALFEKFNIEVLATNDRATDQLEYHQAIQEDDWPGRVIPTFRPDKLLAFQAPNWKEELGALQQQVSADVFVYHGFLEGLRERREYFQRLGCVATDHGCLTPFTDRLSSAKATRLFDRALRRNLELKEAQSLQGHLLVELAGMSCEDGMTMQLHCGAYRDHHRALFEKFGPDLGADIPVRVNYTRGLEALLNAHGSHPNFKFVVFTLDESNYARELAPLAGHYPCMRIGPPWWFHDSLNGMMRYFDQVMETAGVFNTVGFNDDTRAFCSIPARHDLWRRASCRWLSGLVADGIVKLEQAHKLAWELAIGRAREAYGLSAIPEPAQG
ncbi:MAG: glucuronate isomerase [Vulcanimicrobiota bacterium]